MKAEKHIYKVVAEDNTIFLYGYIGQLDWEDSSKDITDINFAQTLRRLEKQYDEVHIRINSPGGKIYHGDAMLSAISNSSTTIHTWNDGLVASMAFDIYLAGDVRHTAKNAKFMTHPPSGGAWGTAADLREAADVLDTYESASIALKADLLGTTIEDVKAKYYDGKDHWFTAAEALEHGFVTAMEEVESENVPAEMEKMTYAQIVQFFQENNASEEEQGMLQKLKNTLFGRADDKVAVATVTKKAFDMQTIQDITQAAADGTINKAELVKALTQEEAPSEVELLKKELADLRKQVEAKEADSEESNPIDELRKELDGLKTQLKAMDETPAGGESKTHATGDPNDGQGADDFFEKVLNIEEMKKSPSLHIEQ